MHPTKSPLSPEYRLIVVGLVWNHQGELLLCKMNPDHGVFPAQWGLPGGGILPGEQLFDALHRELEEELGIEVDSVQPAFFKDGLYEKTFPGGQKKPIYMIFLLFHCKYKSGTIMLNEEFVDYRWITQDVVGNYNLNEETTDTLARKGFWEAYADLPGRSPSQD